MRRRETHFKLPSDALPQRKQTLVVAVLHDVFVQLDVEAAQFCERGSFGLRLDVLLDEDGVGGRPVFGSPPGGHTFEGDARVADFREIRFGEGADFGAAGGLKLDEAFAFEFNQGFADGGAA